MQGDEKKIIKALLDAPDGVVRTKDLAQIFSSGAQILAALKSLENKALVSYSEPVVALTTQAFDRLGHPSLKIKQSNEERRASLLHAIAAEDGRQAQLFMLDERDRAILEDLENSGLVKKSYLGSRGTGLYRATYLGMEASLSLAEQNENATQLIKPEMVTLSWFDRLRRHWLALSFMAVLSFGWFVFEILNPDRVCPLLPIGISDWVERCANLAFPEDRPPE